MIFSVNAVWEQFQSDDLNTGKSNGIGYFDSNTITNFTNNLDGNDKQILVSDIDNNGKNEIIIFSGNYLKVFDNKLNLIDEKFVGKLQGQPTILDMDQDAFREIVFISNISSLAYFFAYEYNSSFKQEFNFTVANGAIGSGIKCTALDATKICVFMDNAQYVHIVNMTSQVDNSYNTSVYNDTREKVPAIGSLHNDNGLEAVFWFDENNNNQYGLLVFDLINRSLDFNFNNSGIVDDITVPYSVFGDRFVLKGHPVLADLNNDNKLEIAVSVFYDDNIPLFETFDWFTELFVYDHNGSQLFRECEERASSSDGNCNDGSSTTSKWEGTNPFVLDSNNDGIDEICFIKDKKFFSNFKNMSINCYDYSGSKILDSEITPEAGTIKIATVADMNNDGIMEIVTENNIYALNGTSIFSHNFGFNFAIPVDIDGNNGLDLILSKNSQTIIYLDDFDTVEASNVSIIPLIPSEDENLACYWVVKGDGILTANVSWYKNNILHSTETNIGCINDSICAVKSEISSSLISKSDIWKCSVSASNGIFNTYDRFKEIKILGKTSEWTESCNLQENLCRQSGKGYFDSSIIENISTDDGMNFEPIAADINNDGKNEIVIFSGSKLKIFNHSLGLINEIDVGILVGQPTIFNIDNDDNKEIVFIVNISSINYLMAYEYNINFNAKCNITLSNGAIGSGIKCAEVNDAKSCFFKDNKNVFYNFNMSSCRQNANLSTNNMTDTTATIPSILDYDKDGKLEGVWWFNDDNDNFMGIAVIELENMQFDTGFNEIGFIDDVIDGSSDFRYTPGYENVKGNPVFYQSDNAGGYEILVAWDNERYFHSFSGHTCFRSNLKLFDTDGDLLWKNTPATDCPIGTTGVFNCDISTPILVDADKDGYDDVCFIMGGDDTCYTNAPDDYFYCLDRFGNNVDSYPKDTSDVNKYGHLSANLDTNMYLADMDNDGKEEMIGVGYIWNLDGTILAKNYSDFLTYAPIPIDLDKNKALDLLWTKNGLTTIFLDNNNYFYDFEITENDILFQKDNVKVTVHNNGNLYAENTAIWAINTDTLENETGFVSIEGNGKTTLNFNLNFSNGQEIMVKANYDDKFNESNKGNNFAFKKFEGFPYVFVSVNLEINSLEEEFTNYIKDNLKSSYYSDKESNADIKIYIGKNNLFNKQKLGFTKNKFDYYYDFGNIYFKNKVGSFPYNGLLASYKDSDIINILIYGNEIDGNIAAVKEFINNEPDFVNIGNENSFFVDDENAVAIKVFDFLHNTGNENNYKKDNDAFKGVVRSALRDEMYNEQDYTVTSASGVNLQLRNLKPNASSMYLSYLNDSGVPVELPVVLARGLWSNLSTWQVLASELSNEGRDAWLIEITGGPEQDCDSCPDYTFDNLTDDYVPSLLNGVLTFTGKDKIQYVGFSNGCRATLSSLEKNKFDSNKIETFIGVGCPGAFDDQSLISKYLKIHGERIKNDLGGKSHITLSDLGKSLKKFCEDNVCTYLATGLSNSVGSKISYNLAVKYLFFINSSDDKQPGENLSLDYFLIIHGYLPTFHRFLGFLIPTVTKHDLMVVTEDADAIYSNIVSNNKTHLRVLGMHGTPEALKDVFSLPDKSSTKRLIKKYLKKEPLNTIEKILNLVNSTDSR